MPSGRSSRRWCRWAGSGMRRRWPRRSISLPRRRAAIVRGSISWLTAGLVKFKDDGIGLWMEAPGRSAGGVCRGGGVGGGGRVGEAGGGGRVDRISWLREGALFRPQVILRIPEMAVQALRPDGIERQFGPFGGL